MKVYENKNLPVDERVEDLLSRMTLKEKVGQLNQKMYGWNAYRKTKDGFELTDEFKKQVSIGNGMGALYGLFRADPWSSITFENGVPVYESAKMANRVQRYVKENSRLGIPVLLSEECPHGHQALDGTLFPTNIGMGSTWNPTLVEESFGYVAAEIRARGGHLGLISCLDIMRDPRWGRAEECCSEDPYLAACMTAAITKGLQGDGKDDLQRSDKVAAVLKHLCAQGNCEGGRNLGPALIGERELREIYLPGMKAGVEAGALGCMAAYNEIDGIPCHANTSLLTTILRDEWGFEGVVMADGTAVDRLRMQAGDYEAAAAMALSSGIDLSLWDEAFTKLENAVMNGKATIQFIDRAVRRILRLKFLLGLFENPFTDETTASRVVGHASFLKASLEAARESVVLLENKMNILPLNPALKKIAIIGPNANNLYNQLGDYTSTQRKGKGTTVFQGIQMAVSTGTEIVYAKGCGIRDKSRDGFAEAILIAQQSDVVILVFGGSSTRDFDIHFDVNGAAIVSNENPSEMDCGEGVDVADLRLGGVQEDLAREIAATGTRVIIVLIQGRPHALSGITEYCDALLCAWYPGPEGGQAIGEILFGKVNPSGRLSVSIPRSSSQLPVYYNYKDLGKIPNYCDSPGVASYPFGFGLSYTTFIYSHFRIINPEISVRSLDNNGSVEICVDIENTGLIAGAEVVQLYIRDMEASITRRVMELKGFQKIVLGSTEKKTLTFYLKKADLGIWNHEMRFVVEPGNVKVMIGCNSSNTQEIMLKIT